jgi:hypothetical protein
MCDCSYPKTILIGFFALIKDFLKGLGLDRVRDLRHGRNEEDRAITFVKKLFDLYRTGADLFFSVCTKAKPILFLYQLYDDHAYLVKIDVLNNDFII